MVKYGDIAKDRLKPFDDDFEGKIKLATKVKANDGKTTTTLKWAGGVSAKVQHKANITLPVAEEVSYQQTMEFSQKDYSLTSEFSKAGTNFQGSWKQEEKGATSEFNVRRAFGAVVAAGNAKFDAEGKANWKVNAAYDTKVNENTTVQVGGQVNDAYAPEFSLGVLSSLFGNFMFKTDLNKHATASLFPLKFLKSPLGYKLSVGHSAAHTAGVPLKDPSLVVIAQKGKDFTIKTKFVNVNSDAPSPSVSFILKAPVAITGTWSHAPKKGHVFGINMSL